MIRHLCIRAGNWKFENWRLYRLRRIVFGKKKKYNRVDWKPIL